MHLADGTGLAYRDEHLVPGRGSQPCAPLLAKLTSDGYSGVVVLEVNTRRAPTRDERLADLAESLDFARTHLGTCAAGDAVAQASAVRRARATQADGPADGRPAGRAGDPADPVTQRGSVLPACR